PAATRTTTATAATAQYIACDLATGGGPELRSCSNGRSCCGAIDSRSGSPGRMRKFRHDGQRTRVPAYFSRACNFWPQLQTTAMYPFGVSCVAGGACTEAGGVAPEPLPEA